MFRKMIVAALLLVVVVSVAAIEKADAQSVKDSMIAKQRESFRNAESLFVNALSSGTRGQEIKEATYQTYSLNIEDWVTVSKRVHNYDHNGRLIGIENWYAHQGSLDNLLLNYAVDIEWTAGGLVGRTVRKLLSDDNILLGSDRVTCKYNDKQQITSVVFENYKDVESWEVWSSYFYTYNEINRLSSSIMENIHYHYRTIYNYDERGRIKQLTGEMKVENEWGLYDKTIYNYHSSDCGDYGNVQNSLNNFAMNYLLGEYGIWVTYSNYETITSYVYDESEEDKWLPTYRFVLFYNEKALITKVERQEYCEEVEKWVTSGMDLYYYDDNDLLESYTILIKDNDTDLLMPFVRHLFSYIKLTEVEDITLPKSVVSIANYPNPFNPETTIVFNLQSPQDIELNVYNAKGQLVRQLSNGKHQAGEHRIVWDGKDSSDKAMSSGLYFYHLKHDDEVICGKMMMIK